jgi:thioredoxin reductase
MPKGMMLKSEGFASNIYDPDRDFTLKHFCAEKGIEYSDSGIPVRLDTFSAYGLAFRDRKVPELEDKTVVSVDQSAEGFVLGLDTGEVVHAKKVVLAVGITHFEYVPDNLAHLPAEFLSHSSCHVELEPFRGRNVIVLGAGASALDVAGLLHEAGAKTTLVARRKALKFHGHSDKPPSWFQRLRNPQSGLGPGWKNRFFSEWPMVFYYLPEGLRLEAVRRALGPSGGWFIKDKVIGRVSLLLGQTPEGARIQDGKVVLSLVDESGKQSDAAADHVIAATGYRVNLDRLAFLNADIRSKIKAINRSPVLSSKFESSVPGLYFVGVAAANSFGPLMRFAYGAGFAARTVTKAIAKSGARDSVALTAGSPVATTK